jgi:predicted ATPase/DNA-binding CsgD family transcriptional regulator
VQRLRRPENRLLTLTGPPGVGKTRLALAAVAAVESEFQSGAVFVNLAPVRDPELFEHTLIQGLGSLRRFPGHAPLERLSRHIADRHILLLLDNFEQIMAASLSVAALLESCPRLHVLVTSREALRLGAEREFPVQPLVLPASEGASDVADLARAPAVALFVARAQAIQPEFALNKENGRIVAEICRRLDGLPLAIELAAARVKVLPPQALLTRLSQRLPLLVGGTRDLPERHQTLRAAIAWSEGLLEPEERLVFRRLAVFANGFTLEAAHAVAAEESTDTLTVITSLVNKSLLRHEASKSAEPRFGMLETVREYAWEQLTAAGESEGTRDRHLEYLLNLAERAKGLFNSEQAHEWFAIIEQEYENFRAALRWASERAYTEMELRMGSAICQYWSMRGNLGEGYRWVEAALAKSREAPAAMRAKLLHGAAAFTVGDAERAIAFEQEALALARSAGDRDMMARALFRLGLNHLPTDPQKARRFYTEGLEIARDTGDKHLIGIEVQGLAMIAQMEADAARAARLHAAADAIFERYGLSYSPYSIADQTLLGRSIVAVLRGLGQQAFAAAWAEGRRMPLEILIDYALGRVALPAPLRLSPAAGKDPGFSPLSPREREVAGLVTQGLSNREIAKALTVSERTVDAHVQHILNKLGFNSRVQIAAWVAASGAATTATAPTA